MSTWTFRTLPPELANTALWRSVDIEALEGAEQQRFIRFYNAITSYLANGKLSIVCRELSLDRHEVIRQLNRCVTLAPDGKPYGWAALLNYNRITAYERKAPLPNGAQESSGYRTGAFSQFLRDHPEIQQSLHSLVFKRGKGKIHELKISVRSLHRTFVAMCERADIGPEQYPLNSKSRGRRSLERYVQAILLQYPEEGVLARHGPLARSHLNTGRGISSTWYESTLYDVVGLDPHKLHCIGTVRVPGPRGFQRIAIERLWIVPILDEFSRAILGYSVGIRKECSAATIEQAIISAMSCWAPRKPRIPGVKYQEGGGLPSGLFPELSGRGWTILMMDNAATHYSAAVAERARRRLGCFLNYGPIGHWEHRAALERVMRTLEIYGFQRLPSSTGSNSTDPTRSDPVRAAVQVGIDWEDLLDLIDVEIANYNITAHETLGNRSPLSVFRDHWLGEQIDFLARRLPPPTANQPELGTAIETKFVRGSYEDGRRPYVEIDRVHYTSPVLSGMFGLIGEKIRVHICGSDMRTVSVYFVNGQPLGVLNAHGAWGRTPHTREMRKQINALRDSGQLTIEAHTNPIDALLHHYSSQAHKETERNAYKVSKSATKLVSALVASRKTLDLPKKGLTLAANETKIEGLPNIVSERVPERALSGLLVQPQWKTRVK